VFTSTTMVFYDMRNLGEGVRLLSVHGLHAALESKKHLKMSDLSVPYLFTQEIVKMCSVMDGSSFREYDRSILLLSIT